ncbi:MAG: hypothetical protein WAV32_06510 [Halobacteriota archaeon]
MYHRLPIIFLRGRETEKGIGKTKLSSGFSLGERGFQKCIVSHPDFTKEDIENYVDRALKEYYLSPSYIPIAMKNILRKNGLHELKGMVMSAKVFMKYLNRKKDNHKKVRQ